MRKIEFMLPHWGYPIPMCFLNFQPTRFGHLDSFIANIYIHTHTYIYKLYDINYRYTNNNIQIFSSCCVNFQKKISIKKGFNCLRNIFPLSLVLVPVRFHTTRPRKQTKMNPNPANLFSVTFFLGIKFSP